MLQTKIKSIETIYLSKILSMGPLGKMDEDNKLKIEGASHKPNTFCLRNPKKPKTAAPTPGLEIIYFKFGSTQDATASIKTKDNIKNYSAVSFLKIVRTREKPWITRTPQLTQIQSKLRIQQTG